MNRFAVPAAILSAAILLSVASNRINHLFNSAINLTLDLDPTRQPAAGSLMLLW